MAQRTSLQEDGTVSFAAKIAASEAFRALFREGMTLVEETAAYLDGPGRVEAKQLSRLTALSYAAESMRLTTRLMQLASWLLLQRAVNEGELSQTEAATEKRRIRLAQQDMISSDEVLAKLPPRLNDLITVSMRLQSRIIHLDKLIYRPHDEAAVAALAPQPVQSQIALLREAFRD
jgi:regulator of CtrA degradation